MKQKYDGHIYHSFRRIPLALYREQFTTYITKNLNTLRGIIINNPMSDDELISRLVTRDLLGIVLRGNGFFWLHKEDTKTASRYYEKAFTIAKSGGKGITLQIRVSDHYDYTLKNHKGRHERITINYLCVDDSNDAIHLAAKRAIKYTLF